MVWCFETPGTWNFLWKMWLLMRGRGQTAIQWDMVVLRCINLVRMCVKMGKVQVSLISLIFLLGSFGVTCQADLHHDELKSASWRTFFHSSKSDRTYVAPESGESKHMTENTRGAVKFNALRTISHRSSKRAKFASSSQVQYCFYNHSQMHYV